MLIVMDGQEDNLTQSLQTYNEQFKSDVTFLTVYNGIFEATNEKKNTVYFAMPVNQDAFFQTITPRGAYELEFSIEEIKK